MSWRRPRNRSARETTDHRSWCEHARQLLAVARVRRCDEGTSRRDQRKRQTGRRSAAARLADRRPRGHRGVSTMSGSSRRSVPPAPVEALALNLAAISCPLMPAVPESAAAMRRDLARCRVVPPQSHTGTVGRGERLSARTVVIGVAARGSSQSAVLLLRADVGRCRLAPCEKDMVNRGDDPQHEQRGGQDGEARLARGDQHDQAGDQCTQAEQ